MYAFVCVFVCLCVCVCVCVFLHPHHCPESVADESITFAPITRLQLKACTISKNTC